MTVYITQLPYGVMNSTVSKDPFASANGLPVPKPLPFQWFVDNRSLCTARRENGAGYATSAFEYRGVLSTNIWPSTCFVRDLPRGPTMTISRNCALLKRLRNLPWRV